mmetsp:Transcript_120141/g.374110  ORF Transcript_120141/g.374110 Transcript_120141/m.374110 type:complete len:179 (-) Transcript_120141:34-570(-)
MWRRRATRCPLRLASALALFVVLLCRQSPARAFLPPAPARRPLPGGLHLLGLGGASLGPALARADDAFTTAAGQAGIPTQGVPMPPSDSMVLDLWKSWGSNRAPMAASKAEDATGDFPTVVVFVLGACLVSFLLPQFTSEVDVEAARRKGKPEWLVEEEAERKAEKERKKVEAKAGLK